MPRTGEQSIYTLIARHSLEKGIKGITLLELPVPLPEGLERPGAVFVSLKKNGALRGRIGTIRPLQDSLSVEIAANALNAALDDPRFPPVTPSELDELEISVDLLSEPEKVEAIAALDPRRYGVIVSAGRRSGLLLPDLEGIDTAEQQLQIARQKAGIHPHEAVEIYRFTVERHY